MARRKDSPQKAAMREMMRDYLKNNDISIKDGTDVNSIMRDMMSVLLEGALDEELDEELGYSSMTTESHPYGLPDRLQPIPLPDKPCFSLWSLRYREYCASASYKRLLPKG